MKKRILSLLVVVCMVLSITSFTAFAENTISGTFTDDNSLEFSWSLNTATGAFAVEGTGSMTLAENAPVKGQLPWVNYEGTDYRSQIKSVTIGSGITRLGRQLFEGCTALTEVTIPGNVTHTGWGVFNGCTSLTKATFEEGFLDLGDKTFMSCTALAELNLPSTVKLLRQNIVMGCTSLMYNCQ